MIWRSKRPGRRSAGIEHVGTVRGRDNDDAFLRIEAIHLDEQRIQRLFALVVAAAHAVSAMPADGVDFVDEDNAGRGFLALLKHVAHPARADADKHFDKVRAADGEEGHVRLAGDGAREQGLARARRPDEQNALGNAAAEFLELLRVTQELDQLLHLILRFLDAGDVLEGDLVLVPRQHARLRLAEVQGALARHADLLPEKKIENEEEGRNRHKADQGLGQDVRLRPNRDRHVGRLELFLEVGGKIQKDRGSKRHLLFGSIAHPGPGVSATNRLCWPTLLNHQTERKLRIVHNLFVREQVEKTVVRHVLLGAVAGPATEQNRQADQGKSDREEDNTAPIEVRIAPSLGVFLRIAIWLGHRKCYPRSGTSAKSIMKTKSLQKSRSRAVTLHPPSLGLTLPAAI